MMNKLYFAGLALLCSGLPVAAGTGQGTIGKVEYGPLYGTKVFFSIQGEVTEKPSCSSDLVYQFVFDSAVPGGKEILSSLLLAKTTAQSVKVSGFNSCSIYEGVENLRWIRLE
jgi:hypothetical protein